MTKKFAPRVKRKERKKVDLAAGLDRNIFKVNDEKLLKGAELDNVKLSKITVKKQVRTKFNDDSIKELASNIKENGLIQPLVVYRDKDKFVLICGERRFRAMSSIDMKEAPCFILENKTNEELMAIQFSENSVREQLHYIDQADSISGYKKLTGASERKIQAALGISKSEVHRCLLIAKMPKTVKEAAKKYNTEKYVLLEWHALDKSPGKEKLRKKIVKGDIRKRVELKKELAASGLTKKTKTKKVTETHTVFMNAMKERSEDMKLDKKTKKLLESLIKDSQQMLDL